jgi:hypothetical protein
MTRVEGFGSPTLPPRTATADRCAGVTCFLSGECVAEAGTCDPATGLCGPGTPTEDGTECSLEGGVQGSCQSGVCTGRDR